MGRCGVVVVMWWCVVPAHAVPTMSLEWSSDDKVGPLGALHDFDTTCRRTLQKPQILTRADPSTVPKL